MASQYTTALISSLGQFKTRPNPRRIFRSIYGRGFLAEYVAQESAVTPSQAADERKLEAIRKAREKFRNLRNRGPGTRTIG